MKKTPAIYYRVNYGRGRRHGRLLKGYLAASREIKSDAKAMPDWRNDMFIQYFDGLDWENLEDEFGGRPHLHSGRNTRT